jgi:hypothetical protein
VPRHPCTDQAPAGGGSRINVAQRFAGSGERSVIGWCLCVIATERPCVRRSGRNRDATLNPATLGRTFAHNACAFSVTRSPWPAYSSGNCVGIGSLLQPRCWPGTAAWSRRSGPIQFGPAAHRLTCRRCEAVVVRWYWAAPTRRGRGGASRRAVEALPRLAPRPARKRRELQAARGR